MNKNPWKSEDLESLEKSTEDSRLEGHKTQIWGSETAQHAITNANVISLVSIKQVEKWLNSILTKEILFTETNVR